MHRTYAGIDLSRINVIFNINHFMKIKKNIYLKLFLATAIPCWIFTGIYFSLQLHSFHAGLMYGIFIGLFYGIFMALILGFIQSWSVKRMPYGKSDETMGVHQVRVVYTHVPYEKGVDPCIESLKSIRSSKFAEKILLMERLLQRQV